MVANLLHVATTHQSRFDALHPIAQFSQGEGLTVVEALSVATGHRHGGGLVQTLIQQKRQQGRQDARILLVIGVTESCEHRGHVLGRLDVLAFNVVYSCRHLNVWGEAIEHACAQECCHGIGMTEIGRETVEGIAQSSMPMEPGEKSQTGHLFAEHIRLVGDVVMAE